MRFFSLIFILARFCLLLRRKTGTFNAELNYRGWYSIKYRNVGNTTTLAMFDITFYNFEKDQTTISLALGIIGIALITAQQILRRRKPKPAN